MFNLFRSPTPLLDDYSFLAVDMHSHLLPGIDDGAKTIEDSISLIKQLKEMGFQRLITTPHIMADLYPNTPEIIKEKLEEVRRALRIHNIKMPIDAAAEYLMDEAFGDKIAGGNLLTLPGNRVLVEMSFISPPPRLEEYLFQLQTKGYRPVLAHPERYLFYRDTFEKFHDLKTRGCEFQLNLLSLTGYYGKPTKDIAIKLLKDKMITFLGTDMHHERHAALIQEALKNKTFNKLIQKHKDQFQNQKINSN